jgi:hypothetical protein
MSSPKTRRSSPKPKKGINTTNSKTVRDKNLIQDPPAKPGGKLSANDLWWNMPTIATSMILKHASRTVYANDFKRVG